MEKDYSLLIAATVAIVAIVGLVISFGSSSSGAMIKGFEPFPAWQTSPQGDSETGWDLGGVVSGMWSPEYYAEYGREENEFCSYECGNACAQLEAQGKVTFVGDCEQNCDSRCVRDMLEARMITK